jgi:hypothetical protein
MENKTFKAVISYYKIVTVFSALICFILAFYKSFDPAGGLEMMIVQNLYGTNEMPVEARPMYEFVFLLFDLLSLLTLIQQYIIIRYALQEKQKWAYWCMWLIGVAWPIGAGIVAVVCHAPAYFVSVGMMLILFFPPLLILRKHFK